MAIISDTMARRYWPDEDPLGKRITIGFGKSLPREIVGVVGSVKHLGLNKKPDPEMYVPYAQQAAWNNSFLIARTADNPTGIIAAVQNAVWATDKDVPVTDLATMEQVLASSVSQRRFNTVLMGLFASVALTLATVGIYGVMSCTVAQNTREIGIRMALGAQPRDVLKLVVGQGLMLTLLGIGIGVLGAYELTRLMSNLLFGVTATDPLTFIGVSLMLTVVALTACYLPARRALKVDPIVALRYE